MVIFNGLWQLRNTTESSQVSTAALCAVQFGKLIWRDGSKIEMGSIGLDATWTTSVHADSDGEEKQRAGGRERNRRGNEYLTVTHGVKERNVSLGDLLVFFIPPLSPLPLRLRPPPLTRAPCRLKYASIIVWEIGSRGL